MRKTILTIFFLCSFYLSAGIASAGESKSEEFGLTVATSDRWVHEKNRGADYFAVSLSDSKSLVHGYIVGVKQSAMKDASSQEAWFKKTVENYMKKYSEGYGFTERMKDVEKKLLLGDATEVFVLEREVMINHHDRSLLFCFWKREIRGESIWYFARFFNRATYHQLGRGSEVIKELMTGIK